MAPKSESKGGWAICLCLLSAAFLVYANSLHAPFLFDDDHAIINNPRIRHLWPVWGAMRGTTRPLTLLTLAVNYAFGGLDPWGYHVVNVLIHGLAGIALYALIHGTLLLPKLAGKFGPQAKMLAFMCALLWLVHPLQTESVAYVIQRSESLMGLWYLLTLYCVLRGASGKNKRPWYWLAVLVCALGMASKPVMVTAPLLVLAYDWVFLSKSWKGLLRERGKLYLGLMGTWIILLMVTIGSPEDYQGTAGFSLPGVNSLVYLATQARAITQYVKLSFWPRPLQLSYGWPPVGVNVESLMLLCGVFGVALASLFAALKRSAIGFLGVWFFGVLAPTSSFFVIADVIFEHRMYLPLAAVIIAVVLAAHAFFHRRNTKGRLAGYLCCAWMVPAVILGGMTARRNEEYRQAVPLWKAIVDRQPMNARAHGNLGYTYELQGRLDDALSQYAQVLTLTPHDPVAHSNLGTVLAKQGRLEEAADQFQEAVHLDPNYASAHFSLGLVRVMRNEPDLAVSHLAAGLWLDPENSQTMMEHLRSVSSSPGQFGEMVERLRKTFSEKAN